MAVKLSDFAVKFGRNPSLEGQQAFPFVYTFVNHNDDTWAPVAAGTQPSLVNLGPIVPAYGKITQNVLLDADYNYKLLAIKYSAYCYDSQNVRYFWYFNSPALQSEGMDPFMEWPGTAIYHSISMTLSFQGSGSTILYGGQNTQAILTGTDRIPLPLDAVEGYEEGHYVVRTPYLLPRQGSLSFEISNSSRYAIVVAAAIYGMKIRL